MQYTLTGTASVFDGNIRSFKDFTLNILVGEKYDQIYRQDTIPVQEGWTTKYSIDSFTMSFLDMPSITSNQGMLQINNITQAEAGAQVPNGLSMQFSTVASNAFGGYLINASFYGADSVDGTGEVLPQEPYAVFTKSILSVNGTPGSIDAISAVPEPFTGLLMACGLVAIGIKQKSFPK